MTTLIYNPRERTRFLRFAVVGTIGAVVDFGVSNFLIQAFSFPLVMAGTISFIAAILSNFFWNRFWTYPDSRSKKIASQLVQFAVVSVMGLVIRVPILHYVEPPLESLARLYNLPPGGLISPDVLADNLTLALAVFIVMFWNFFANRYWTYADVD
jgi:putative flippase GtrA